METITEILARKQKKARSERAELISFFVENLWNKDSKHFSPRRIAVVLSHIKTKDLYYVKSIFQDTMKRRGVEAANKEFWWSLK